MSKILLPWQNQPLPIITSQDKRGSHNAPPPTSFSFVKYRFCPLRVKENSRIFRVGQWGDYPPPRILRVKNSKTNKLERFYKKSYRTFLNCLTKKIVTLCLCRSNNAEDHAKTVELTCESCKLYARLMSAKVLKGEGVKLIQVMREGQGVCKLRNPKHKS